MPGALDDLRVVDFSDNLGGQYCARLLADFGAEVIRVERAELATSAQRPSGFIFDGRGRRAITVDLKHAEGVETVLRALMAEIETTQTAAGEASGTGSRWETGDTE